jgi:predicted RNA-binding protein with PUA-like domain
MAYWIAKSDPETYSIFDLQRDGKTIWDGVRNFQARNNLAKMAVGDTVLIYHSNIDKAIVGIAEVLKEAFLIRRQKMFVG